MAGMLEISAGYLSRLENTRTKPSTNLLKRIADTFGVPVSFLIVEGTCTFKSKEPKIDAIYKKIQTSIHQLRKAV
jgi:transcriptional regulator with XRE-family HTH domain